MGQPGGPRRWGVLNGAVYMKPPSRRLFEMGSTKKSKYNGVPSKQASRVFKIGAGEMAQGLRALAVL